MWVARCSITLGRVDTSLSLSVCLCLGFSTCDPNRGKRSTPPGTPTASCLLTPHVSCSTSPFTFQGRMTSGWPSTGAASGRNPTQETLSFVAEGFLLLPLLPLAPGSSL